MKKRKFIEKEIEKRLISILSDGAEVNAFFVAYKKKASKKELKKFQKRMYEKYENAFDTVFGEDSEFDM